MGNNCERNIPHHVRSCIIASIFCDVDLLECTYVRLKSLKTNKADKYNNTCKSYNLYYVK